MVLLDEHGGRSRGLGGGDGIPVTRSNMPTNRLLLVDGTGVAYRAYYAIASLSTRAGRPTNAVFGFIKMMQQLQQAWKPSHCAVVFDGGLPEERMAKLPTYKAQREPMPDPLRQQFQPIEDYLGKARVPSIRLDAQEADDVIATLAETARRGGAEVLLASSDKDLYQLVNEQVGMVPPSKVGTRIGPPEVFEKTGVWPASIVEWLALTGDTVDNIPGVPGVGPKTAAKLLGEFGGLQNLWQNLDKIGSARVREALAAHRQEVARNVELVTLRRDIPVSADWDAMKSRPAEPSRLVPFYEEMEFFSLARTLRETEADGPMLNFGERS